MAIFGKITGTTLWNCGYSDFERCFSFKISPILDELLKSEQMNDKFLSFKLTRGGSVREKQYNGNFHEEYGLPQIEVNAINLQTEKPIEGLKGFIDTGASFSIINKKKLLELGFKEEDFVLKPDMKTINGNTEVYMVSGVTITSNDVDFSQINFVLSGNMDEFDVAIGNDLLKNCQFNYDALIKSFTLKSFVVE
jgi:hypothetical protein